MRNTCTLEDTAVFSAAPDPADAVHMQNCGVRGKAGPDSRMRVVPGPLQNSCKTLPVWLVGQVRCKRLSPGYNQPVEVSVPKTLNARIELFNMARARFVSWDARQ